MSPEQLEQFNNMQERLNRLERADNQDFVGSLEDIQIVRKNDFDTTGITGSPASNTLLRSTVIGDGGGTVTTVDAPDFFLYYKYKGRVYRLWANELTD